MVTAILVAATAICALGWLVEHVNLLMYMWYMTEKKIPFPSEKEMQRISKLVADQIVRDLTGRKPKHWP